jgi:hypothetical protein
VNDTILWLLWDEGSNTFNLFNEASGRFGPAFAPGSRVRLQTSQAALHLTHAVAASTVRWASVRPAPASCSPSL